MKRNAWIDASDLADVADEEPHDSYFRNTVLFNDALQVSSIHALVEPATGKDLVLAEDSLQASFVQRKRSEGPNATYGSREASQRRSSVLRLLLACQVAPPCQETLPSRSDTWPSQCRCYCLGHACTSHRLQDCRRLSLAIVACQLLRGDLQWTLCYHPVYFALRDAVSTGGFEKLLGTAGGALALCDPLTNPKILVPRASEVGNLKLLGSSAVMPAGTGNPGLAGSVSPPGSL
eukprot:CAMPEP_0178418960 /NCGR_PEP_ID=MMETSP0689_2-20121128/25358_1 /TAXON_ID=160604 /ORGANISM="Amphidinium massartii, Strain CS-259" /LENGTH=233 /DNA_ID=CAMNT_0020040371 /DNA_START=409 /DNA_END=1108 /DNA_ORIENTATION=+